MTEYDDGESSTEEAVEEPDQEPRELTDEDRQKLSELDANIEKFEQQKRWSDMIRTILSKVDVVVDTNDKIDLLRQAGTLYVDRSSNQAEAIKCFERLLKLSPQDPDAIARLIQMYEKRRDWEKLIGVMQREVELLPEEDRPSRYAYMADLATERLRKPEICIDLWEKVRESDPDNANALTHLSTLYERARRWEPLAEVLKKLTDEAGEGPELKAQLQKLGMIYADKIGDDAGAVQAFERLLDIDPDDRRAQEQLKRRYVAVGDWEKLEDFYGKTQKWDELIRILERQADAEGTEPEQRAELLFKAAQLWEQRIGKPERAGRVYEKILASDPDNLRAAEALTPIYEGARDARKLLGVLQTRLDAAEDADTKVLLLNKLGRVQEERLRAPDKAFDYYLQAFSTAPTSEAARAEAERMAAQNGDWDRLVSGFESALEQASETSEEVAIRLSYAQVLNKLGQTDNAIAQLQTAHQLDGSDPDAIAALSEMYTQTEQYPELLDIYETRLELEEDPAARRDVAYRKAALFEGPLSNQKKAIASYEAILEEFDLGELEAYRALDRLYQEADKPEELAAMIERRVAFGPESEQESAALKFRLARLFEDRLDDKEKAVGLHQQVLAHVPEHDGARESLEQMLVDDDVAAGAARVLEPVYEANGQWERLCRALKVRHRFTDEAADRQQLLNRVGEISATHLADLDQAFGAHADALREVPSDVATRERLEVLASERGRFDDLSALFGELGDGSDDETLSRTLWVRAAEINEQRLNDADAAIASYNKALDQDDADAQVLAALEALYRREARWADLSRVLRGRVDASDDDAEKVSVLATMAEIHSERLDEGDAAIALHQEILELAPGTDASIVALERLYGQQQMWPELAENLEQQLNSADDPQTQTVLMIRLAEVREHRLDAAGEAIEIYRDVLARDPQNPPTIAALERLLNDPDQQEAAAQMLEPIYHERGDSDRLTEVFAVQALHAASPDHKVELLHRAADIQENSLGDWQAAFGSYANALKADPRSDTSRDAVERLGMRMGPEAVAGAYERAVESCDDPDTSIAFHRRAAELRENELGDPAGAAKHHAAIIQIEPESEASIETLERLYQQTEQYDELAGLYEHKATVLLDLDERKEQLYKAARIYEDILEQPGRAVTAYSAALDLEPEDLTAIDKMIDLYQRTEQWGPLLETYRKKADLSGDFEEQKRIYAHIGALYEHQLEDDAQAIASFQRVVEIDPDDKPGLARLSTLYRRAQDWPELLNTLERQSDLSEDPAERLEFRFQTGEVWHRHMGEPGRAVDIYRDVLADNPSHQGSLNALEVMMNEGAEAIEASRVLEPVAQQLGDYRKLAQIREVQIAHTEDPIEQHDLLHQLGELHEVQLDDLSAAFNAYGRALPLDIHNERTISSLERLGETLGRWRDVSGVIDAQVAQLMQDAPDEVPALALRSAMIHDIHLDDTEGAITRYQQVLDTDPGHVQAIEALDRLYESAGRYDELVHVLKREVDIAASPDQLLHLQYRIGQAYQHQLGKPEEAIDHYREIVAAAPEHHQAVNALEQLFDQGVRPLEVGEVLEPLYRMNEQWDRLLSVQEVQVGHQGDLGERVAMMHRIAEIAEDRAHDTERAFTWMQRAVLEDPSHDHSLQEAERLGKMIDGWDVLAATYVDSLDRASDAGVKAEVGRRLARVYELELFDVDRAEQTYRYVVGVKGDDDLALEALDRLYSEHGAHDALAEVLERRIAATDNRADSAGLHFRLGRLLERDLERPDDAIRAYKTLLSDVDPDHADGIVALRSLYLRLGRFSELVDAYERELSVVVGDEAQAKILASMARLASDHLDDQDRAVSLWKRVLDLRGEDAESLNAIGNIYADQGNWRDLVDILEREATAVDDDETRANIYNDLARVWRQKLDRQGNAIDNLERVLDLDPSNTRAMMQIADIQEEGSQWRELTDTFHRLIQVGAATLEDSDLERLYMRLGRTYTEELDQPMEGAEAYRQVLEVNPQHLGAIDALEAIYRGDEMWRDVVGVMEQRAEALDDVDQRVEQLLSAADVWSEQIGDPDGAVRAYERILTWRPLHERAFESLVALHTDAGRWDELVELYVGRVEATEEAADRVALLREIARVYEEKLEDGGQAYEALQIAWTEDLSDKETAAELERVTAATDKWNDLLTSANALLSETEDPPTRIQICLYCAKWYGQDLGHTKYAIPYYEQIRALDPTHAQAWWQLGDLYEETKQWDELAKTLKTLVEMTDDPGVKADTYVRMGDLLEDRFANRPDAESNYRNALEAKPDHLGALEALERIYREDGKAHKLLTVLQSKAEVAEDPEAIVSARLQVAQAYEDSLDDKSGATEQYEKAIEVDPTNVTALRGLERLYEEQERWQDLSGVLERQVDVVVSEREKIEALTRLAQLDEFEFRKPEQAATRFEQVLDVDPLHIQAMSGLERLYRQTQQWDDLVRTYDRHINTTPDRDEKIRLFTELGELYSNEADNDEQAIDAYLNVTALDELNRPALSALTRLYEKTGNHAAALDTMERVVVLLEDPAEQVDLKYRMGQVLDTELGDRVAALDHYQTAIDLDEAHLPSLAAIRQIHADGGDWMAAAKVLEQEAEHTQSGRAKSTLFVELGHIAGSKLDEPERALSAFEAAHEQDPDNGEAALPLAEAYVERSREAEALPLLQGLMARADGEDRDGDKALAMLLGKTSATVGDFGQAVSAYEHAYDIDSNDVEVVKGLASSHFGAESWDKAFKYYQTLLVQKRDELGRDEVTDVFFSLGAIKRAQGEDKKARNMFDKALEEDGHFVPALDAVVDMLKKEGDWTSALQYTKRTLDATNEPIERSAVLQQIGEINSEHLGKHKEAIAAFTDASDIEPDNPAVLHKLLDAQTKAKQWPEAIDTIERITALVDNSEAKAQYTYTIGAIMRDEMQDEEGAIERFNEALDINANHLKAFSAIEKIITKRKDWKALERTYRKMLHRVIGQGKSDIEFNLWHGLGIIYRDRQRNFEAAAEAFKMASVQQPDNALEHQILAELYTASDKTAEAIDEHQWLLRNDPNRVDSYRALYKLYFDARAYDKAWCVAATLNFIKKADAEQEQFYKQYRQEGLQPSSRIGIETWMKDVRHPLQHLYLSKIMEVLGVAVHKAKATSDRALKIHKHTPEDLNKSSRTFTKSFKFVSEVLSIPIVPRLLVQKNTPGGMADIVGSAPPALICGSTLLSGYHPSDLRFVVGRHLTYYRPEHFIRTMIKSHTELRGLLIGAMRLAGVGEASPDADAVAKQLNKSLEQAQKDILRKAVRGFVDAGGAADIKQWMQMVELTAVRAGFIAANDLEAAARMAQEIPSDSTVDLPPKDKVKALVLYSVSESYFRVREALGIQIKV